MATTRSERPGEEGGREARWGRSYGQRPERRRHDQLERPILRRAPTRSTCSHGTAAAAAFAAALLSSPASPSEGPSCSLAPSTAAAAAAALRAGRSRRRGQLMAVVRQDRREQGEGHAPWM